MVALDVSESFNKVNQNALLAKFITIGVLGNLLNVEINWHLKLCGCVHWFWVLYLLCSKSKVVLVRRNHIVLIIFKYI